MKFSIYMKSGIVFHMIDDDLEETPLQIVESFNAQMEQDTEIMNVVDASGKYTSFFKGDVDFWTCTP